MNVILREDLHDQALHPTRVDARKLPDAAQAPCSQDKYRPENSVTSPACRRPGCVRAARAARQAEEDLDPVREGSDLVGDAEPRGDELIREPRARCSAAIGRRGGGCSAARAVTRAPTCTTSTGRIRKDEDDRRNLWQELQRPGRSGCLIFSICNPLRMQQQTTSSSQFVEQGAVRRRHEHPPVGHHARSPTSCCPRRPWGEYTYTRENLKRRLQRQRAVLRPAGRGRARST